MTAKITEGVSVKIGRLGFGILLAVCLAILNFSPALAQVRPGNRYEKDALDWYEREIKAGSHDACGAYGALWLTKDSDDDPFGGDQVGVIDVPHDATEAFVRMRGSVWNCNTNYHGYDSYASNIRRGSGANANRLFLSNGRPLFNHNAIGSGLRFLRGKVKPYGWSDEKYAKNHIRLKIDIRGFANPGETKDMTVSIFRCFSSTNSHAWEGNRNCKSDNYYLTIRRAQKPAPTPSIKSWQIEARSFVKKVGDPNWGDPSRMISATPGQQIDFRHRLINRGDAGSDKIKWSINSDPIFAGKSATIQSGETSRAPLLASGLFLESSTNPLGGGKSDFMRYTIKPSDVGKTLCQQIDFSPNAGGVMSALNDQWQMSNGVNSKTKPACVYVAADYQITPIVPLAGSSADCKYSCDKEVEAGGLGKIPPAIIDLPKTKVFDVEWKLSSFVVKPDQTAPGKTNPKGFKTQSDNPCALDIYGDLGKIYSPLEQNSNLKIKGCQVEQSGKISSDQFASGANHQRSSFEISIDQHLREFITPEEAPVGTKYCFALSISPHKMDGDWTQAQQANFRQWYHGEPGCIVIVKKPKVQVLGGGIFAKGSILSQTDSDLSFRGGRYYGSWVEYEALSIFGQNRNFATNGVFSSPNLIGDFAGGINNRPLRNRLALANNFSALGQAPVASPFAGKFGKDIYSAGRFFGQMKNIFNSIAAKKFSSLAGDFSAGQTEVIRPRSSEIEIGNLNVEDRSVIIFAPEATVKIHGNIKTKSSKAGLAQVVILAKNIKIDGLVEKIDSWLISADSINTCYRHQGSIVEVGDLRDSVCEKPLEITGPVMAAGKGESLKLRRTAGSVGGGDGIGAPAEIFNLNPETYLWLNNYAAGGSKITTTHFKELPVRF